MVSVVGIGILLLISGIFFSSVIESYKVETTEEKGLKAYYIAEAGLQYGMFQVLDQSKDTPVTQNVSEPYEGKFTVTWTETDQVKQIYLIESTGIYKGITRKLQAQYTDIEPTP